MVKPGNSRAPPGCSLSGIGFACVLTDPIPRRSEAARTSDGIGVGSSIRPARMKLRLPVAFPQPDMRVMFAAPARLSASRVQCASAAEPCRKALWTAAGRPAPRLCIYRSLGAPWSWSGSDHRCLTARTTDVAGELSGVRRVSQSGTSSLPVQVDQRRRLSPGSRPPRHRSCIRRERRRRRAHWVMSEPAARSGRSG